MGLFNAFKSLFAGQQRAATGDNNAQVPDGWTDDLNIQLQPGQTVEELVNFIIGGALQGCADQENTARVIEHFGLSHDDAVLALDRTFGGIVRAGTGNVQNRPDKNKDPLAWISYNYAVANPSLIARIYPPEFIRGLPHMQFPKTYRQE